jgi:hypothetical protein
MAARQVKYKDEKNMKKKNRATTVQWQHARRNTASDDSGQVRQVKSSLLKTKYQNIKNKNRNKIETKSRIRRLIMRH